MLCTDNAITSMHLQDLQKASSYLIKVGSRADLFTCPNAEMLAGVYPNSKAITRHGRHVILPTPLRQNHMCQQSIPQMQQNTNRQKCFVSHERKRNEYPEKNHVLDPI